MGRVETAAGKIAELDHELVSLNVACRVAHTQLATGAHRPEDDPEEAKQMLLVAIALATVAPLYRKRAEGEAVVADAADLQRTLFRLKHDPLPPPDLSQLGIRRGDLRRAIESLRTARIAFGRPRA